MRVAVIDVGTNTTRLLAAESLGAGRFRELQRWLTFTRLGEGVDATGLLSTEGIRRTLEAITKYCAIAGELAVDRIRISMTSAVRDGANRQDLIEAARKISAVEPELLAGETEAELSFHGAIIDLDPGKYLVCDIGGGSTEFVMGDKPGTEVLARSLDIGAVRLTERYVSSDPPSQEELGNLEAEVAETLGELVPLFDGVSGSSFVGVAGTVTTLAAIKLGLRTYEPHRTHLSVLTKSEVAGLYRRLGMMRLADRLGIPALPEGRADVIVAGAAILAGSMEQFGFGHVLVSEKDILDGLVLSTLGELERSV